MRYFDIEELEDRYLGKIGTPRRDAFEEKVKADITAYHINKTVKVAVK